VKFLSAGNESDGVWERAKEVGATAVGKKNNPNKNTSKDAWTAEPGLPGDRRGRLGAASHHSEGTWRKLGGESMSESLKLLQQQQQTKRQKNQ